MDSTGKRRIAMGEVKKTALNSVVRQMGGRMVEFAGWEMPVSFSGIIDEHIAVRTAAGLFDVSHMGEIEFRGRDALSAVQRLVCNDAAKLREGQAMYAGMLYPNGTFVDDLLVYKVSNEQFMFCVNAANTDKDYAWVMENVGGDVQVSNRSDDLAQLALQGPNSRSILQKLTSLDLTTIRYYWFRFGDVAGVENLMVSATGYTGERGFEVYIPNRFAEHIWEELFAAGADYGLKPAGLGARDTLRLEAGMMLYGNDIDDTTTPFEADLSWIVKMDKGDFIGRDALQKQLEEGLRRKLVGLEMVGPGIPRHGYEIQKDGRKIGYVTSGTMAPFLKKAIGLGYVSVEHSQIGSRVDVVVRGKPVQARIVAKPFYRRPKKKG